MFWGVLSDRLRPGARARVTDSETVSKRRTLRLTALLSAAAAAQPALAQSVPTQPVVPTREEIDAASRTPVLQPRAVDPVTAAQAQGCAFAGKGTVTLTRIDVTGATLVPGSVIQRELADLFGKPSDLAVLCEARDRVARLYAARGESLARVDLPEQRISEGVLTLAVTEGRIVETALRDTENVGPAAAQAQSYFSELEGANAARWSDVQRAFLLTREIPGADVGFSIRRAGDGSPNGLEAVATFRPRRLFDLTFNGHNLGSRELGREGVSVRLDANSFTPLAERTTLIAAVSSNRAQRVFQLLEEFRVGPSGAVVMGDIAYSENDPKGALEVLELEGRSWVGRLGGRYPLVRSRALSSDFAARFEYIDQKNDLGFIQDGSGNPIPLFRDELRVLAAELLNRWQPLTLRNVAVSTSLELRKGIDAFGSSERGDLLLSRSDARPDFFAARFGGSIRYGFDSGPVVPWASATVSGQWSPHGLPAYEEYQIGNYTVGRGYDPGAASGDRGLGLQLEAGVDRAVPGAALLGGAGSAGLFGFFDVARVWNKDPLSYDSTIRSIGGGLRLRWPRTMLSLFYADPQRPPFPSAPEPDGRVLVTLTRTFSIR